MSITAVGAAGLFLLDSVRWTLPAGCGTVGGLVRASRVPVDAPADTDTVADETRAMEPDVIRRVRVIVSEQMGVPIESLTPQTRFIEDLHVD